MAFHHDAGHMPAHQYADKRVLRQVGVNTPADPGISRRIGILIDQARPVKAVYAQDAPLHLIPGKGGRPHSQVAALGVSRQDQRGRAASGRVAPALT